ncbi:MAG: diaminopimelate epimerase [Desulfarculaceae bacterium]|nr:diaminopimelate epimerase [Desulfarculaceae bacterium]MCF8073462.1 diaminopimelate epimerase [Desulfarculaceae bacterium]MCF8100391.1 diaminopimelate epimerase [Desulfarculaceae bacterium]MCF8115873.1 diaminopimelate epimerase [Desulfarculaceae bacterium]
MTKQDIQRLQALEGAPLVKMTGTGNDFVLMDNREARVPGELMPLLAKGVCQRRRSVGADGLVLLEPSERVDQERGRVDWQWHFFNADGSAAEMCGNAGRCAARFARDIGLAGEQMLFDTIAGPIRAWVGDQVKLEMVQPFGAYQDLELEAAGQKVRLAGINTGVPHAVVAVDDIEQAPVKAMGRELRYHQHFAPAGTNVNFVSPGGDELLVRTYERGVEDETLACGTGSVASALMLGQALGLKSPVTVSVRSGEKLKVYFDRQGDNFGPVFLEGAADYVFSGTLKAGALAWLLV